MQKILSKNKTVQKTISIILIIGILAPTVLFSAPKKAQAIPVTEYGWSAIFKNIFLGSTAGSSGLTAANTSVTTALAIKTWAAELLKQVLRAFARRLLAQMTQSTVNWINSGFHGAPLFVESPGSFFKDIAKYEIKNLVNTIGYDNNRFPFGKSFAINGKALKYLTMESKAARGMILLFLLFKCKINHS